MNKYKPIFVIVILVLLSFFFLLKTAYHLPTTFENEPGGGAFGGIRLHYLKVWNFDFSQGIPSPGGTSHALDNFWKSFSYSFHGLLSYLHWYVYVGIFDLFGISITESHLLFCQALLLTLALFIFSLSLWLIFGSGALAAVFLVIASPLFMPYGRSYYVMAPHLFYLSLFFYSVVFYFYRKKSFFLKLMIGFSIFLNMASGNAILLPLFPLFAWCVAYQKERMGLFLFLKKGFRPSNLLFLIPLLLPLAGHLYVYSRVGVSNLGLLGWGFLKLGHPGGKNTLFDIASLWKHLKTAFEIYIQNGVFSFWGSVILLFAVILSAKPLVAEREGSLPVKLFILIYFVYASSIQANVAILPLILLLSLGMTEVILFFYDRLLFHRSYIVALMAWALFLVGSSEMTHVESVLGLDAFRRPPSSPNDLKAIGYVLREHMTKGDKIASFLSDTDNILNEFYYGKTFFKSPVFGKEIYSLGNLMEAGPPVSREEVDREFAFYVVEKKMFENPSAGSAGQFMNALISKYNLKKFSDIGGKYEIYSSRPIPYRYVDIGEANAQFDEKYANLKALFYHHHVGVASTWGFY